MEKQLLVLSDFCQCYNLLKSQIFKTNPKLYALNSQQNLKFLLHTGSRYLKGKKEAEKASTKEKALRHVRLKYQSVFFSCLTL